jgi:N-acetylmuramoyl-L-alanine amidase
MSKIIEHFLVPLFVVVSVLYAFNSFGSDGNVQLNKVYHHTTHSPVHLERANVSLYFSGDPQLQEIKNKKTHDTQSCTFFFPQAVVNKGECELMVKRLRDHSDCYSVSINEVVKPVKGIVLVFNFDQSKFSVSYERFDSIGLHKGVVFRLYNKELLKQLEQANNQPVLRTLWHTGKPCIAIDPGHGGADCGAIGQGGIQEKDICLAIGKNVGNLLKEHGCSVVLTRNSDCAVGLDERTSYANNIKADFFVSIHANYAANSRAVGVETFCLQPGLLKRGFSQLSDREHGAVSDVRNQRFECSYALAQSVQHHLCHAVLEFHDESIDRKVKHSVAQVLLGAQMSAVLVEVGFVSHKKEAALLNDIQYQNCVARGICDGILSALRS